MTAKNRITPVFLITYLSLATSHALGAEPTEEMRTFARMFATLEARDLKGYCAAMHGAPYVGYLSRVCQSAVQNKVKKPEECSQESIAKQVEIDNGQCLAMPAAEFEKMVLRGDEGSQAFVKQMAAQGIDGEKLLQDERKRAALLEKRERAVGGAVVLDKESDSVKALAAYAVAAQSAATGADLKLLSIKEARILGVAFMPYEISLIVLKDGKQQSARASLRENSDRKYRLIKWEWASDTNSRAEQQRTQEESVR